MAKRKPHNPAEDMRLRLEQAAARAERDRLKGQGIDALVVAEWDENKVKHWVAKGNRKDVFRVLLDRRAIDQNAFDAIRRYEEALDTSMGHNSPERRPDYIRASSDGAPGQNISQAMILASHRARWVRDRLSATDMRLLDTLRMNAPAHWRQIVQMVTGEVNDDAHAPRVRAMAENVRDAMASFDRLSKKAA
ncbi:hypothetical protein [Brevundimonas pondensis]|uniref:Uncharacterized protein n=1 Tax=Brevundimonas pondensis TaxID=2774189 RepID=A0ABX7SMR9_9CAUL|nr:hypothetical protein [Brevundimonas pondensis]QTC88097.1 hypothetical protein IFE19_01430 [Brevundimonas pondensis]